VSTYIEVFNAPLVAAFAIGEPFTVAGERVTLHFEITVTGAGARPQWFPEFTGIDNFRAAGASWFRETVEATLATGVVNMPASVREFQAHGGIVLPVGTHRFSINLVRADQLCRIQMANAAGVASALVRSPFGSIARA